MSSFKKEQYSQQDTFFESEMPANACLNWLFKIHKYRFEVRLLKYFLTIVPDSRANQLESRLNLKANPPSP